ncbi:MAG: AAA family ATPase [Oscillospiraceae bacterium]
MKKTTIISVANQKGGVGKTTTAFAISSALVKKGFKVLMLDLDPQASLTTYVGFEQDDNPTITDLLLSVANNKPINIEQAIRHSGKEDVYYIPSTIALASAEFFLVSCFSRELVLKKVLRSEYINNFDYVIIDCLPSLGILLVNALAASDKIIIPVQAQKLSLDGIGFLMDTINMVKENINSNIEIGGVIATMVDNTNMAKAVIENLQECFANKFIGTISKCSEATYSTYNQESLVYKKSKLGQQYQEIAERFIKEGK